jgi:hypothetical protein
LVITIVHNIWKLNPHGGNALLGRHLRRQSATSAPPSNDLVILDGGGLRNYFSRFGLGN